jgi:hypothetical protein
MPNTLQQPLVGNKLRIQWKEWIMMRLGSPVIKVELTEEMVDSAIDSAVKIFSQWVPQTENIAFFTAEVGCTTYDLKDLAPGYLDVRDVIWSSSQSDSLLQGYFTDFNFGNQQFFWYQSSYATMTDFTILNMYNEMYLRTIGKEPQWEVIGTKLILSPSPTRAVPVAIIYTEYGSDEVFRRDEWLRAWALTECKEMLGEIRRKYSSLPGPRGDVTMNGSELMSEAREDQATLRERLNEYIMPALFEVG